MKIKILQIKDMNVAYKFCGYKTAKKNGFSLLDYDVVFNGDVDAKNMEDVFMIFNMDNRPNPRGMHSLSVSDIVINDEGMWYCDNFGWARLV